MTEMKRPLPHYTQATSHGLYGSWALPSWIFRDNSHVVQHFKVGPINVHQVVTNFIKTVSFLEFSISIKSIINLGASNLSHGMARCLKKIIVTTDNLVTMVLPFWVSLSIASYHTSSHHRLYIRCHISLMFNI